MNPHALLNAPVLPARQILAKQGKTFYVASFFLPSEMAQAATRLYRFCRYVDDIADTGDNPMLAAQALDQMMAELRQGHSQSAMMIDALALFHTYAIPIAIPIALIEGVRSDLVMTQLADDDALMQYCYRVAGTVGIMMAKILAANHMQAYYHAVDLGIAMQLTNICRDVTEDANMQRVYLPQCGLNSTHPSHALQMIDQAHPRVLSSIGMLLQRADQYYDSAYQGLAYLPMRARLGIFIAAQLYQRIGHEILRHPTQSLKQRMFISGFKKTWVIMVSLGFTMFQRKLWTSARTRQHAKALHQHLTGLPMVHD